MNAKLHNCIYYTMAGSRLHNISQAVNSFLLGEVLHAAAATM